MYSFFSHNSCFYPLDDPKIRRKIYSNIVKALTSDRKLLKKIKMYFDPVDYDMLRNYVKKHRIEKCVYTTNYLLIYTKYTIANARIVVIGYDRTRGKLFVNLCDRTAEISDDDDPELIDKLVREQIYGYNVDVDQDEYVISSDRSMSYRVQGDLVVNVSPILDQDVLDVYIDFMTHSFSFYQSYSRYVIFKIHTLLNSLRIHHVINDTGNAITIERTLYKYSKSFSDNIYKLIKLLRKLICDHIGDLCKSISIDQVRHDGWGNSYKQIVITVTNVNYTSKLVSDIKNLIKENVKKDRYVIFHGNHRVEIDQAYPRSIRLIYDDHEFTASLNHVFVDRDTTITITHDQHGKVVVKFDRPYEAIFRSTNTALEHDLAYSFYSIKRLLREYKL